MATLLCSKYTILPVCFLSHTLLKAKLHWTLVKVNLKNIPPVFVWVVVVAEKSLTNYIAVPSLPVCGRVVYSRQ